MQVGIRVRDGVAHTCLGSEIHDLVKLFFGKELVERFFVVDTHFYETTVLVLGALNHGAVGEVVAGLFNAAFAESAVLEAYIVIVVNIVEAHHIVAAFREHEHKLGTNKTCCTSNKNLHNSTFLTNITNVYTNKYLSLFYPPQIPYDNSTEKSFSPSLAVPC